MFVYTKVSVDVTEINITIDKQQLLLILGILGENLIEGERDLQALLMSLPGPPASSQVVLKKKNYLLSIFQFFCV